MSRKGIVVYKSKYGATKKYAQWLCEETGFDMCEVSEAKIENLVEYEVIVFGGGIYASGVPVTGFIKKNIKKLVGQKIIVFCDGASPYEENAFKTIREHVMKDDLKDIPFFYCRGAWNMEAMSLVDRNLCKMLQKAVAKKDPSDYEIWETALMEAGSDTKDWTDKSYLKPIIDEINR